MDRRLTRSRAVKGGRKKSLDSNSDVDTTSNRSKPQNSTRIRLQPQKKKAPVKATPARTTRQTVPKPLVEITLSGDEDQSDASGTTTSDDEQQISRARSSKPPVPHDDETGTGTDLESSDSENSILKKRTKIKGQKGHSSSPCDTAIRVQPKTKVLANETGARSSKPPVPHDDETGTGTDLESSDSENSILKKQTKIKGQKGHSSSPCDTAIRVQPKPKVLANETGAKSSKPPVPHDDETGSGTDLESSNSDNSILMKRTKIEGQKGHSSSSCDTAIRVQPNKPKVLANETVIFDSSGAERDEQDNDETEPLNMSKQDEELAVSVNSNEQEEGVAMDDSIINMNLDDIRKACLLKKAQLVDIEIYVKRLEAAKLEKELGLPASNFTVELF